MSKCLIIFKLTLKSRRGFFLQRNEANHKIEIMDPPYTHSIAKKNYLALLPELRNVLWQGYPSV